MKKKLLSILLVCMMIVTVLGGCGKKNGGNNTQDSGTKNESPTNTPDKQDNETPVADEKPPYSEITVEVFDRGTDGGKTDPTNNYYTDWIKQNV